MDRVDSILEFWFGKPGELDSEYGQFRKVWFQKQAAFDARIREQFLTDYQRAAAGDYHHWHTQPRPCLALILLLDQFPRNLFRGQPQSFATDAQAVAATQQAIAQNYEAQLIPVERFFLYLPLEHSEALHHQDQCVARFEQLVETAPDLQHGLDYAHRHRDIIARFGRFPHRNAILGRSSTPAEIEFLQQPGSRF
jgi:uncharacterized protein (DUF924 family)